MARDILSTGRLQQWLRDPQQQKNEPRLNDGAGLSILSTPLAPSKKHSDKERFSVRWVYRYSIRQPGESKKMQRSMVLGPFSKSFGLSAARAERNYWASQLRLGKDPITLRNETASANAATGAGEAITFERAVREALKSFRVQWTNTKSEQQWSNTLLRDYCQNLHEMDVRDITAKDVADALLPIWESKAETSRRIAQRIRRVLAYATASGYINENQRNAADPEILAHLLPQHRRNVVHHKALDWQLMPRLYKELARVPSGRSVSAPALRMLILTVCRSREIRDLTWSDVQLKMQRIVFPGSVMKEKKEHIVPLTSEGEQILGEAALIWRNLNKTERRKKRVFPSLTGLQQHGTDRAMSDVALVAQLRRCATKAEVDTDITAHGLRSSFRDWAAHHQVGLEVAESVLAHVAGQGDKVAAAYRRSSLFEARIQVMQDWEDYLTGA